MHEATITNVKMETVMTGLQPFLQSRRIEFLTKVLVNMGKSPSDLQTDKVWFIADVKTRKDGIEENWCDFYHVEGAVEKHIACEVWFVELDNMGKFTHELWDKEVNKQNYIPCQAEKIPGSL